jgi:hypothetical protein
VEFFKMFEWTRGRWQESQPVVQNHFGCLRDSSPHLEKPAAKPGGDRPFGATLAASTTV